MNKTLITIIVCIFFSALIIVPVYGATIYLNNGKIYRGEVVSESEDKIVFEGEKEWHEIDKKDIWKIKGYETRTPLPAGQKRQKKEIIISTYQVSGIFLGPKLGVYMPVDSGILKAHNSNLLLGFDAVCWKNKGGLLFELESFTNKGSKSSVVNQVHDFRDEDYTSKMNMTSAWVSRLFRNEKPNFGFWGFGFGVSGVKEETNISKFGELTATSTSPGVQALAGFGSRKTNITIKYSYLTSPSSWNISNLGGVSMYLNLLFKVKKN